MNEDKDNYYHNPERTGQTFEERTGDPDSFSAAIGRIVLNFSHLDVQVSRAIVLCLGAKDERGEIAISELSFKSKIHVLSSLVKYLAPKNKFNTGDEDSLQCWIEIQKQCFRAEEKRNQIMHSEWVGPYLSDLKAKRIKNSVKSRSGFVRTAETIDSGDLFDIADYIALVTVYTEEFFLGVTPN